MGKEDECSYSHPVLPTLGIRGVDWNQNIPSSTHMRQAEGMERPVGLMETQFQVGSIDIAFHKQCNLTALSHDRKYN